MQVKHWIIALAAFASALPAAAKAAVGDPIQLVYRASGVTDDGSPANNGVATVIHCTNVSQVSEQVAFIFRNSSGASLYFNTVTLASTQTYSIATHGIQMATVTAANTGVIAQGFFSVGSTTLSIFCSAMVVPGNSTPPAGLPLHMLRYNPATGTNE